MKMRKILATLAAAVVACSAMVSTAFAADAKSYSGYLGIMDLGDPQVQSFELGKGTDCSIAADGTYTVSMKASQANADVTAAKGFNVLVVDVVDLSTAMGINTANNANYTGTDKGADKMKFATDNGIKVTNVKLSLDGKEVYAFKDNEILFGDLEGNGKFRIELYNEWGAGTKDLASDELKKIIAADTSYEEASVTFTISGVTAALSPKTDSTTESKTDSTTESKDDGTKNDADDSNKPTGATAGLALAGLAIAGAAVVATKKSK